LVLAEGLDGELACGAFEPRESFSGGEGKPFNIEYSELARLCLLCWLAGLSWPSLDASMSTEDAARRRDNAAVGAFATNLLVSPMPSMNTGQIQAAHLNNDMDRYEM
jgi:hypothetical protein